MQISPQINAWQSDINYWFQKLGSTEKGLSKTDARKLLLQSPHFKKPKSVFSKEIVLFIGQFKSPLMLLLIGAAILSPFLGDTSDVFMQQSQ